jgi:hypothetical protein
VTPEDVPELVRLSETGQVWLPGYRGRSCWPRSVQVAECFLRRETGETRIDAFRPVEIAGSTVTFVSTRDQVQHRIEYSILPDAFHQRLTCESAEESAVSRYEFVSWTRLS